MCLSVDFFSTLFLRVSNQGILAFKSGYSLKREIGNTLELGTDKTDRMEDRGILSVLSVDDIGGSENSRFGSESWVQVHLSGRTSLGLDHLDAQPTEFSEHFGCRNYRL